MSIDNLPRREVFLFQENRTVIFINGIIEDYAWINPFLEPDDFLIAVDGGYKHMKAAGLKPRLLVGDLDSIQPQDASDLEASGVEILKYPPEKDQTDLEIALTAALQRGSSTIRILGGFGGRTDHLLANLFTLLNPAFISCDIRFEDQKEEAFLIHGKGIVTGKVGDLVSLIPIGETVHGVSTHGLRYPLENEPLFAWQSRGVSNEMTAETARVVVEDGCLLCIHRRMAANP